MLCRSAVYLEVLKVILIGVQDIWLCFKLRQSSDTIYVVLFRLLHQIHDFEMVFNTVTCYCVNTVTVIMYVKIRKITKASLIHMCLVNIFNCLQVIRD